MADAKKGTLIVLEGLDGSGKATQAKLLAQHLKEAGKNVQEITFPDYASDSSALVKMYLAGQFGDKPDDVNAYAASSFYAVDRYASYKTSWGSFYEAGGVIIADRYTKDVHEKDVEYLARSRNAAEFCAAHLGWETVHCTQGDAMRSIEDIQSEVRKLAQRVI